MWVGSKPRQYKRSKARVDLTGKSKRLLLTLHIHLVFLNFGSQRSSKLVICSRPDTAFINNEVRKFKQLDKESQELIANCQYETQGLNFSLYCGNHSCIITLNS